MSKYDHTSLEQLMTQIRHELDNGQMMAEISSGNTTAPRLPTSEIMRRVRAEVARRRAGSSKNEAANSASEVAMTVPHWQTAIPKLSGKREYALGELLVFSDLDFVSTVYQVVLRRKPSQGELAHYLALLRDGNHSKIEILGEIRWSREGVARGVHVDGLLIPYTLRKWERRRFVGPVLRWLHAFAKLGQGERRSAAEAARQGREIQVLGDTLNGVSTALDEWRKDLEGRFDASIREVVAQQASLSTAIGGMRSRLEGVDLLLGRLDFREEVEQIKSKQASLQAQMEQISTEFKFARAQEDLKLQHAEAKYASAVELLNQRNYALLETQQTVEHINRRLANVGVPQPLDTVCKELKSLASRLFEIELNTAQRFATLRDPAKADEVFKTVDLDPFYAAFEDHFRGGRDLVRERARPYIELVRGVAAGTSSAPVLDIGCGRGEWLELLREHGLIGRGIDLNRIFIEICRGHGLDVTEGDAISVLSALPDNSVGAITSMHLVEHLPFEQLIILLDEAYRVLIPGGLLLLETPNPENLSVGAHTFYLDPTHRNPIPPVALQWMVQARGFRDAVVDRLTVAREMDAPPQLAEDIPGASSINSLLAQFNIAPDYAIIAKRP